MGEIVGVETHQGWYEPTLEEKTLIAEQYGLDALYYCKDPWALRHRWVNKHTGEMQRARCNRWECQHCGPRKVVLWRQLVRQAEPTLFLTLTKAGKTVAEARRALTTFMQALRRGSKGRGPNHKGAREAYPVEYFAVLERHSDFERNGFHWHILMKGVEHIPYKEVIVPLWTSAIKGKRSEAEMLMRDYGYTDEEVAQAMQEDEELHFQRYGWIEKIRNVKAIGYVTKYLMKALSVGEQGTKEVKREREVLVRGEDGMAYLEKEVVTERVASKAHRICYSRQFFPESVAEMRKRLFAGVEHEIQGEADEPVIDAEEQGQEEGSGWTLIERELDEVIDMEEYKRRYAEVAQQLEEVGQEDGEAYQEHKREIAARIAREARLAVRGVYRELERRVLQEAIAEGRPFCRRVLSVWDYHRKMLRLAG
ncbi:rolling circle replication-associated protein [Ktedonobacter robiniae]|uniref:Replication-associated protein ORF2/G2P domain-containing protein n=1 Tax=Ktedonobacter robiniae TaxID=2778365 RepID=A0ABQ3UG53_9CHLR|nr:hypothetical protein [Ktedonobacter robiniae]GHO51696.1 hypothetical protein KSB_01710 [Ktedonobacter robiniae]